MLEGIGLTLLLQESIAHVPLIVKHIIDGSVIPLSFAVLSAYSVCIEHIGDVLLAMALQVQAENPPYDFGLLFIDRELSIFQIKSVCRAAAVKVTRFHALFVAPTHIS